MTNYFRITGYNQEKDFSFIIDCNGMFEKKWQFSSMLVQNGLKVLEISDADTFLDVNIERANKDNKHIFFRAGKFGKPEYINKSLNGITYRAVQIADKIYIPNKEQTI